MRAISTVPRAQSSASGRWTSIAGPLVVVLVLSVLAAFWLRPMVATVLAESPMRSVADFWLLAAAALAPAIALARALLLSGVTLASSVLIEEPARFGTLLRIYLLAEIALACSGPVAALVLSLKGAGGLTSAADLSLPLGLDRLWLPSSPLLASMVRDITVFHVAWIFVVAFGLRHRAGLSREGTLVGTLAAYAVVVGASAVRAAIMT